MGVIELLENNSIITFIRESPSVFGYTMVISFHAMGLATVVGLNWVIAFRLLGFAPALRIAPMLKLFPFMYIGFWVNALSGLCLLAASASTILYDPIFYVKIGFIIIAILNLRFIRNKVFAQPEKLDSGEIPDLAKTLSWVAIVCWGCAIIAGRLTAYPTMVKDLFGF